RVYRHVARIHHEAGWHAGPLQDVGDFAIAARRGPLGHAAIKFGATFDSPARVFVFVSARPVGIADGGAEPIPIVVAADRDYAPSLASGACVNAPRRASRAQVSWRADTARLQ